MIIISHTHSPLPITDHLLISCRFIYFFFCIRFIIIYGISLCLFLRQYCLVTSVRGGVALVHHFLPVGTLSTFYSWIFLLGLALLLLVPTK